MRWLLLFALLVPACTLYSDDAPITDDCDEEYVPYGFVDPNTLVCQDFGGYQCRQLLIPIPNWGECDSPCRALGETDCLAASGCRGVYDYACYTGDGPCNALTPFLGCYPVDQSGPIQGACDNLDAWSCSVHDDCLALHDTAAGNAFRSCVAEMR